MLEFSLENLSEKIHYGKTKDYFQEVLSSYHNGNYRSAVVMLWSVAICDIIYKLENLVDIYKDKSANLILSDITDIQRKDPKSPLWETELIKKTHEDTNLLDNSEYLNLVYLQNQRHLSAHPILDSDRVLHTPNKETVRALIRNTLEGLLIKPPFYTKKIIDELLADIAEAAPAINTKEKVKRYVESRYLNRLKPEVEISIYKSLWKLVFILEDENCNNNRYINFQTLDIIGKRNLVNIKDEISRDKDGFSKVSNRPGILNYLIVYLAKNSGIYDILDESAKIKIQHNVESTDLGRIYGWFLKPNLEEYFRDIVDLINSNRNEKFNFTNPQLEFLFEISDTNEWQNLFCNIVSEYYCKSVSYNQADKRFEQAISPYLNLFDKESIIFLIDCIETNQQVYFRSNAPSDHYKIHQIIEELHVESFNLINYPRLKINLEDYENYCKN